MRPMPGEDTRLAHLPLPAPDSQLRSALAWEGRAAARWRASQNLVRRRRVHFVRISSLPSTLINAFRWNTRSPNPGRRPDLKGLLSAFHEIPRPPPRVSADRAGGAGCVRVCVYVLFPRVAWSQCAGACLHTDVLGVFGSPHPGSGGPR